MHSYQSSMHEVFPENCHMSYNQRILIDLLKARQMFHLYQKKFLSFLSWLIDHADCCIFCESHTKILIEYFLQLSLFDYKWDARKFSKANIKYLLVETELTIMVSSFKDRDNIWFFYCLGNFLTLLCIG